MRKEQTSSVGFFLVFFLLIIGCIRERDQTTGPVRDADIPIDVSTTIQIFPDQNDIPLHSDPAGIMDVELESDTLMLVAQAGGGCAEHDYLLFGCHCFMESFPVQTNVFLSHDDHDDPCDAIVIDTLRFDLTPLKEVFLSYYPTDETVILRIHEPGIELPIDTMLVYGVQ